MRVICRKGFIVEHNMWYVNKKQSHIKDNSSNPFYQEPENDILISSTQYDETYILGLVLIFEKTLC
jgi:hypothetical protein